MYVRKDKTKFPVAIKVTPIVIDNKIIGAIEVFRDITKEKDINKAKTDFISIASHQLRTPLTGIQWVVERLLKTEKAKLSLGALEYLDDIHMSATRLNALVDLLLNVSRIEGGNIAITPQSLDVIEFLKSYFTESTPISKEKDVAFFFKKYPSALVIETDVSTFRNIVQSLVSNALEYTPKGGEVEMTLVKKKDTFILTIRDTGIGIPKAEQARLFEKFFRATNAKLMKPDGTGLGLYVVKQAVDLLEGTISFTTTEGKGTTFVVELPINAKPKVGEKKLS